jgi:predicted transcriptional regulator
MHGIARRIASCLMRYAICEYVEREEKREAFRQDGIRAWNEYQTTGLHVTHEEADAWIAKLEAGQDAALPVCHV